MPQMLLRRRPTVPREQTLRNSMQRDQRPSSLVLPAHSSPSPSSSARAGMGDPVRVRQPPRRKTYSSSSMASRSHSHSTDTTPSLTDSDSNSMDTDGRPPRSPPPQHILQHSSIRLIDSSSEKLGFPRSMSPVTIAPVNFDGHPNRLELSYARPRTPSTPEAHTATPRSNPSRRSRVGSTMSFYLALPSIMDLLERPRILARLLANGIGHAEFVSLLHTCRRAREALSREGEAREMILERFVPGYRRRQARDYGDDDDIVVGIDDIQLLGDSLAMPLHRYPTHALQILSLPPHVPLPPQAQVMTRHLEQLSNVHSRFVLLLRSRAVRWSIQLELDDPSWLVSNGSGAQAQSQNSNLWHRAPPREFVFPMPLWSTQEVAARPALAPISPPSGSSKRTISRRRASVPLPSFNGRPKMPPPPPNVPAALKLYRQPSAGASRRLSFASQSLDSFGPTFPGLPPFGHTPSTSMSYLGTFPRTPPSPPARTPTPPSPSPPGSDYSPPLPYPQLPSNLPHSHSWHGLSLPPITSSHDIQLSCLPTRAPIIRVFVPCTSLSQSALLACEGQLFSSGLWPHLHIGDVVCNLGYIPLASSNPASPQSSSSAISTPPREETEPERGWLIFNGASLVPYFPPAPPPLSNPLALPTPTYYTHLSPSAPRFLLALPSRPIDAPTLQPSILALPAPHLGAHVKVQVWRARISVPADLVVYPHDSMQGTKIGEGWAGEWVVEADGTKEGLGALMDAGTGGERVWEVVKGRSRPGRVWLRLISSPPPPPAPNGKPERPRPRFSL